MKKLKWNDTVSFFPGKTLSRRRPERPLRGTLLLLLLTTLLAPAGGWAQDAETEEGDASEGALFLLLPVGARGVALGRAVTALPIPESAFWNPAGLGEIDRGRFLILRGNHLAGEATAFSLLLHRRSLGTMGLSYLLLDVGDQDLRDGEGNVLGSISVRNHLAVASFATQLLDRLNAGVNFKVIQFRLTCHGDCLDPGISATTFAVDTGVQLIPLKSLPLRLGAAVVHAGPRLQVVNAEQADPLPIRARFSLAYDLGRHLFADQPLNFWISSEVEDRWRDPGSPSLYIGTEFRAGSSDLFFARAGYVSGEVQRSDGVAVGVGLRYGNFDLGLAKSLSGPSLGGEGEPVHITFAILFQ